jgi:anti-anti-sigma regulatory factor
LRVTREGSQTLVTVSGVIDEAADFGEFAKLSGRVRIDMRGVHRFNSFGCRHWVDLVRGLAPRTTLTFVACSPAVIDQLNTTYGFLGHGKMESFIGAMLCDRCGRDFEHVFDAGYCAALDGLPEVRRPVCGGPAELDDDADQYLLFLREPTVGGT